MRPYKTPFDIWCENFSIRVGTRLLESWRAWRLLLSAKAREEDRRRRHQRCVAEISRMELELGLREPTESEIRLRAFADNMAQLAKMTGFSFGEIEKEPPHPEGRGG